MNEMIQKLQAILDAAPEEEYPESCAALSLAVSELNNGANLSADDLVSDLLQADQAEVMPPELAAFVEETLLKASDGGSADAANTLGALYYTGRIGKQDFARAVELYTLAAEGGHPDATENLGYCYYYGRSVEKDYEKAFRCFSLGAFTGRLISLYKIGDMYRYGLYADRNEKEAFLIYNRCCGMLSDDTVPQCGADLCIRMGDCLFEGLGTDRDLRAAQYYYQNAELLFYDRLKNGDYMIEKQYQRCIARQEEARTLLRQSLPAYDWL
ncbi:MAG: sel1 repeat family protein [Oscillospiraceae bacterium]|nr:sel1 repeat family protein [Oscillospiraceae bacterium]